MVAELKPCGTVAAYRRHLRNKETACAACLRAVADEKQVKSDRRRADQALEVRAALAAVPAFEKFSVPGVGISELDEAYDTLNWIKAQMDSGVAQGAAALAKQRIDLVSHIRRLESAASPKESALDEIARKRAERLSAASG